MSLPAPVARALYRALRRSAATLERELSRCGALRVREADALRRSAAGALPKDLRGLLDVRGRRGGARALSLPGLVGVAARRVGDAAQTPALAGLDGAAGFAALRHLHARLGALGNLVLPTRSAASTHGVRVDVASSYHGFERQRFMFRYAIRIRNAGPRPIQLLSRAWTIADLDGRVSEVHGPGVVGDFPTIRPDGEFEYESSVPLRTPMGTQRGHFFFYQRGPHRPAGHPRMSDVVIPAEPPRQPRADSDAQAGTGVDVDAQADAAGGKVLQVQVAPFSYRTPSLDERVDGPPAGRRMAPGGAVEHRSTGRRHRRSNDEGGKRR